MYLLPRESKKLLLFLAGELAAKRKARGLKLNYPEAVAYFSSWLQEAARDGKSVAELMNDGASVLSRLDVMESWSGMPARCVMGNRLFLLGPCEPMIPLLFYPGANGKIFPILMLVVVYTVITLITMIIMVLLLRSCITIIHSSLLEKYMHPKGCMTIMICGFAMIFLGW